MGNTIELGLDNFLQMPPEQWEQIAVLCEQNKSLPLKAKSPRDYQETFLAKVYDYLVSEGKSKGKLIMPCGTGKGLMAYWIARKLEAQIIIVAALSLAADRENARAQYFLGECHLKGFGLPKDQVMGVTLLRASAA